MSPIHNYHSMENSKVGSPNTSRNHIPSGLRFIVENYYCRAGETNLDIGAGRYDKGTEYLSRHGITNLPYDPYNRSAAHNYNILGKAKHSIISCATVLNVLNVIPEKETRLSVVQLALSYSGFIVIGVYARDRTGVPTETRDGWQMNARIGFYKNEIDTYFENIHSYVTKNFLIVKGHP